MAISEPPTSDPYATLPAMAPSDYKNGKQGGFINERHGVSRKQVMKWNAESDRKLLLLGLGKEISAKEYKAIAGSFPG